MDKAKDFEDFYTNRLQPFISELKLKSDEAAKWRMAAIAFTILAIFCFILQQSSLAVFFIILIIISIYYYFKKNEAFIDNYKATIINEIINFINPGLVYKPNNYISSKEYKASGHYRYIYGIYDGDDYIEGSYKNIKFHSSEIETLFERRNVPMQYEKGRTIFKGLFFVATINKFQGGTYIWTKGEEQLPTSIMDEHYRFFQLPRIYKIQVADAEFSKYFSVYSTYPTEAEILLDQEMIQRMVSFKKQIGKEVRYSVVAGKFYVSIPIEEELLEPAINTLDDREKIKKYFYTVLLMLSIINQLRLNKFT